MFFYFIYYFFFKIVNITQVTLDPDSNWAKILDPDPNSMNLDPQPWFIEKKPLKYLSARGTIDPLLHPMCRARIRGGSTGQTWTATRKCFKSLASIYKDLYSPVTPVYVSTQSKFCTDVAQGTYIPPRHPCCTPLAKSFKESSSYAMFIMRWLGHIYQKINFL